MYRPSGSCVPPDEISEGLRYTLQTDTKYTLMVSGTGHAGETGDPLCVWGQ